MSERTFNDLVQHCGLCSGSFASYEIPQVVNAVLGRPKDELEQHRNLDLHPQHFVEALVHIAIRKTIAT